MRRGRCGLDRDVVGGRTLLILTLAVTPPAAQLDADTSTPTGQQRMLALLAEIARTHRRTATSTPAMRRRAPFAPWSPTRASPPRRSCTGAICARSATTSCGSATPTRRCGDLTAAAALLPRLGSAVRAGGHRPRPARARGGLAALGREPQLRRPPHQRELHPADRRRRRAPGPGGLAARASPSSRRCSPRQPGPSRRALAAQHRLHDGRRVPRRGAGGAAHSAVDLRVGRAVPALHRRRRRRPASTPWT